MIEVKCTRCDETFVIHDPEDDADFVHGETEAGSTGIPRPCGGIGVIQGEWVMSAARQEHLRVVGDLQNLTPMEEHGLLFPHCSDPDCEFHHPEVREY